VAGTLSALACDGARSTATPFSSLEISPASLALTVGEQRAVAARGVGAGAAVHVTDVFWSSENTAVVTVSRAGIVAAVAPGTTRIAVSRAGQSAVATVSVVASPIALVRVTPTIGEVEVGESLTLHAEALNAAGTPVSGQPVSWASSDLARATVSSDGIVTGVSSGNLTVTATVDGVSGTALVTVNLVPVAQLTVTPASGSIFVGQSQPLAAMVRDASGTPLSGRPTTWSSSAPAIVSVSSTGLATGFLPGNATITATVEELSATAQISVSLVPVFSVGIVPAAATIAVGRAAQLSAQLLDSVGGQLGTRPVLWSSDQPAIASVRNDGLVTGVAVGQARITASVEGRSNAATVTVTPVPAASLTIAPAGATLKVGATRQFASTPLDAQGNELHGRVTTWMTGAPTVATVDQRGLVTAVGAGTALLIGTCEGIRETVTLTVNPITVATVQVAPATVTMQQSGTATLSATILDSDGAPMTGKQVTWTSSDPVVATVSGAGTVSALSVGAASITATADGVRGSSSLTVTPVPVASVTLQPGSVSVAAGANFSLVALLSDSLGNPISSSGRAVSWSSTAPAVASVNASGVVTGISVGAATIIAQSEGAFGQAGITVTAAPVVSVAVSPPSGTTIPGGTLQFTATARDAQGNVVPAPSISWTSGSTAVATVSASGGVTAVAVGSTTVSAMVGGIAGQATVTVTPPVVTAVRVTPGSGMLTPGGTLQLTATAEDANGAPITGRSVVWSSSAASVASVSAAGLVTGVGSGAASVTATIGGVGGAASVTVAPVPVGAVTIGPLAGTIHVGTLYARQVTAQVLDANRNVMPGALLIWSTSDPAALTIAPSTSSSSATLVAKGPPRSGLLVIATAAGAPNVSDTLAIDSDLVPISTVSVSPVSATLTPQQVQPVAFAAQDSAGNAVGTSAGDPLGSRTVSWTSKDPSVGVVTGAGVVTAVAPGKTDIEVMVDGKVPGTFALDVKQVAVNTMQVSPSSATLTIGDQLSVTAALLDASGNPVPSASVSWSVSDSKKASVSGVSNTTAQLTALDTGTVTLSATGGGLTGTAMIDVVLAAVDSIVSIPPSPVPTIRIKAKNGQSAKERFVLLSANGPPMPGRLFTVLSQDPSLVVALPSLLPLTNSRGEGEFLVFLTLRAFKGDVVSVVVTANGKSTTWRVEVR
jgi:uncharacterized protein YjdB